MTGLPKDEETIRQFIGIAMRILCNSREVTIEDMADFLDEESCEKVTGYMTGKTDISAAKLFRVGEFLAVTIDQFFDPYYNPKDYPVTNQYIADESHDEFGLLAMAGFQITCQ